MSENVRGRRDGAVAILVTIVTFGASLHSRVSKVSTVAGMDRAEVAIVVIVVAFGHFWPLVFCRVIEVPTVTWLGLHLQEGRRGGERR